MNNTPLWRSQGFLQARVEKKTETTDTSNKEGTSGDKEEETDKEETAAPRRRPARRES